MKENAWREGVKAVLSVFEKYKEDYYPSRVYENLRKEVRRLLEEKDA